MIENLSLEILIDSKLARKRLKKCEKKVEKNEIMFYKSVPILNYR